VDAGSAPSVFAIGHMVRGQSLVVRTIEEGGKTAKGIDKYLMCGEMYLP
jgi:NADPH-dependent glutamate synthase beta subunit-like oxidoreductase